MRRIVVAAVLVVVLAAGAYWALRYTKTGWDGVDKTVVEQYARAAGRPPRDPIINTDRGDLLLFVFLIAGASGGFLGGYYFRELFPPSAPDRDTWA